MNYIECINVDYKSTRKESFYGMDLELINGLAGSLMSDSVSFSSELKMLA